MFIPQKSSRGRQNLLQGVLYEAYNYSVRTEFRAARNAASPWTGTPSFSVISFRHAHIVHRCNPCPLIKFFFRAEYS